MRFYNRSGHSLIADHRALSRAQSIGLPRHLFLTPGPMQRQATLLLVCLGRHKPHIGSGDCPSQKRVRF
jgi:hypothetical protein